MIELLIAGITLGIYAGFSPGPLLVLVISQTLKHDYKEGVKVAFAPLISDIPIIIICLVFLSLISGYSLVLGIISLIGGVYLGYLSYECFKTQGVDNTDQSEYPNSLQKGIVLNLLNPSPYIFWITIGGPIIIPAYAENPLSLLLFIAGFYSFLVGSKIALSYATGKSRTFLTGTAYIYIMRVLGGILIIFSLYFIQQGIQLIV